MNTQRGRVNPLKEKEKKLIRRAHKVETVLQISKKIRRACATIYRFMDEEGLVALNKSVGANKHTKDYSKNYLYEHS